MSAEDTKPKMLFVCNDGWAHDIQDSRGSQQCKKCNGWLDELVDQYAQEKCLGEILKIEDTAETLQMKSSIPEDQYFAMLLGYIKSRGNILSLSTKEDKDD